MRKVIVVMALVVLSALTLVGCKKNKEEDGKTDTMTEVSDSMEKQDDTVETVLINLIRGAGIQGLTGISAKNGDILRPLLCVDRKEILAYLEEKGQDYVTDSTNLVDDVVRN